ncbi:MAG: type I methionyl aminopeptidase [Bacteroidetes bacterium]|nr:MAG: type I methionyl aminopeptidase [Bacteroidota bacterium]REK05148.1 MAG: type I methionyl aminopeptidase [Bacteroidota bacterium]REK32553.1 MAG: type I methionyl aminopeptidase [Bacteroidota bacterium]REK49000.1 MAG: type I methionyl aminopeptidase [Bacteroidota bacterium]
MLYYKTQEEIEIIRESSLLVAKTLAEIAKVIRPGVTTLELDKLAETFIRDHGAVPAFLNYNGFPNSLCISVNSQVVHGIPNNTPLSEGDICSVDCGVLKNGFYGDSAYTFGVGEITEENRRLLKVTRECLYKGIEKVTAGNRLGEVSNAIQEHAEKNGYSVVRELVGHGIGKHLHEKPEVPNYGKRGTGMVLREGLVIAIEPMINLGTKGVVHDRDGWTVRTADNKPSAHFEHTVAVRKDGADILSSFEFIDEVLNKETTNAK